VVSLRIPPNEEPERALDLLVEHLRRHVPWGARLEVTRGDPGRGFAARTDGPAYAAARTALAEAYGRPVVEMGSGGSVPLAPALAEQLRGAEILLVGAMDDRSNIHAQDESVDLAEVERAALAEAFLLARLAPGGAATVEG
jgi:acetylornithine deacetylase/succinyl-diaminopimelate desuccinylase-like protein